MKKFLFLLFAFCAITFPRLASSEEIFSEDVISISDDRSWFSLHKDGKGIATPSQSVSAFYGRTTWNNLSDIIVLDIDF